MTPPCGIVFVRPQRSLSGGTGAGSTSVLVITNKRLARSKNHFVAIRARMFFASVDPNSTAR
jgi:hypothetical protein